MIRGTFIKCFMIRERHSQLNNCIINCIKKIKKIYIKYIFFLFIFFIHKLTLIVNLSKRHSKRRFALG